MSTNDEHDPKPQSSGEGKVDADGFPVAHWIPEEALEGITMERSVRPSETEQTMAERVFLENLPVAALSIVNLAIHSPSEKIRLDAAKYVVERNLGKPDTASQLRANADADMTKWEQLLADAQFDPEHPNALPNN